MSRFQKYFFRWTFTGALSKLRKCSPLYWVQGNFHKFSYNQYKGFPCTEYRGILDSLVLVTSEDIYLCIYWCLPSQNFICLNFSGANIVMDGWLFLLSSHCSQRWMNCLGLSPSLKPVPVTYRSHCSMNVIHPSSSIPWVIFGL